MKVSVRNDQRGLGQIVIILLVVVVIAAIGFVGYRVMNKKDDTTVTASKTTVAANSKAVSAACLKVYNDKNLCKFTGNFSISTTPYKLTITTTGGDGSGTSTFLSDGKGNSQVSTNAGGTSSDFISLDGATYIKGSDGTWTKYAASASAPATSNPTSDIKFDDGSKDTAATPTETYKSLGKEACGNLTCYKYQVIDSSQPGTTTYVWFDTKDYRLQRYSSKDATTSSDMAFTYQAVKISAPTPVKDAPSVDTSAAAAQAQAAAAAAAAQSSADYSSDQ